MEYSDSSEVLRRECNAIDDSFWTRLLDRPIFKGNAEKHFHMCVQCGALVECYDHYCDMAFVTYSALKKCDDCSNTLVGHSNFAPVVDNGEYATVLANRLIEADKMIAKAKRKMKKVLA